MQYRYFGARPLTEDGQIKSPALGTVNARLGYRFDNGWKIQLDGFNIFNSRSDEITYAYGSLRDPISCCPRDTRAEASVYRIATSNPRIRQQYA